MLCYIRTDEITNASSSFANCETYDVNSTLNIVYCKGARCSYFKPRHILILGNVEEALKQSILGIVINLVWKGTDN